jgi:acyl carrier protein phosphodiesterase
VKCLRPEKRTDEGSALLNFSTFQLPTINYLAHAYLSFEQPGVLTGNLISDFVKGRRRFDYPPAIQQGIILHRAIDEFTDRHAATRDAKEVFRPAYRLYSGAFVDVVYDHFLAADRRVFPEHALDGFTRQVYRQLEQDQVHFPESFARIFPYMKAQNWLYHYQTREGAGKSFGGLVRRALHLEESDTAFALFERHYQRLEACYRQFWEDVLPFARQKLADISGS